MVTNKRLKSIISVLICLIMVLVVSSISFAEEGEEATTGQTDEAAINNDEIFEIYVAEDGNTEVEQSVTEADNVELPESDVEEPMEEVIEEEIIEVYEGIIGSTVYNAELDVPEVVCIGFTANPEVISIKNDLYSNETKTLSQNVVLYIYENDVNGTHVGAKIEGSDHYYYILKTDVIYNCESSGYSWAPPVKHSSGGSYSTHSGDGWRVTYYGPEPWANGGNSRLANGDSPYDWIGRGVAVSKGSGYSLGDTIDVPGHGPMTVVDYGAPSGVIDVLIESESMCN